MWTLSKSFTFEAAHQLPRHDGKCARLHGHSWRLTVEVEADSLHLEGPQTGMVMDYGRITKVVQPLVDEALDHWYLNESTGLENPTSEALAQWVYEKLQGGLPGLVGVTINETCTSSCRYVPE